MFLLIQLLSSILLVSGDLIQEYPLHTPSNEFNESNLIASSLWAMGVCSCVSLVCLHKRKMPFTITPKESEYTEDVCYQIDMKEGESIKKFKNDLDEMKKVIDRLYKEEKEEECKKTKQEKNIEDDIDHSIRFKFGEGEIRYKEGEKYYHGVGINDEKKFGVGSGAARWLKGASYKCMFEYIEGNKLPNKEWDTHNVHEFCNNCSFDVEKSKRRRVMKVYKCNGHEV